MKRKYLTVQEFVDRCDKPGIIIETTHPKQKTKTNRVTSPVTNLKWQPESGDLFWGDDGGGGALMNLIPGTVLKNVSYLGSDKVLMSCYECIKTKNKPKMATDTATTTFTVLELPVKGGESYTIHEDFAAAIPDFTKQDSLSGKNMMKFPGGVVKEVALHLVSSDTSAAIILYDDTDGEYMHDADLPFGRNATHDYKNVLGLISGDALWASHGISIDADGYRHSPSSALTPSGHNVYELKGPCGHFH